MNVEKPTNDTEHNDPPIVAESGSASPSSGDGQNVSDATQTSTSEEAAVNPEAELDALKSDLDQAERRVLMAQAELENFRKRMRREMEDERRFASLPLIKDLLTVVDNLQRATEAAEKNDDSAGLLEGVKMVAGQFETVLEKHNCQVINPLGEEFDPNRHEAISQQPSDEYPAGHISLVYSRGYLLHDRVVRPAQVIVSTGTP